MEDPYHLETLILLLVAVLVLTALARRFPIPYPILLVLGGLGLSFVPHVPVVRLDPDVVFLIFLPPILWAAAYFTSLRDFRANLRSIMLLAVGLVVVTTVAVAVVARAVVPGMSWPVAVALGAIVSPPDAVAATAIARRLRIPYRLVAVLEGESLVNDAAALVLYRVAVVAAVTGSFAISQALWQFVIAAAGGVIIGLLVGAATSKAMRLSSESPAQIAITLLAPYVAWILAERAHTSAVLACVAGGIYIRQVFSAQVAPATQVQTRAVWDLLIFVLNGLIFVLIGLQLGAIRGAGLPGPVRTLLWQGALISATAIGVRLVWVPLGSLLPRLLSPALRRRDPIPPWRQILLLAWIGMRGVVSLAAALALPVAIASGAPFPYRDQVILFSFGVILATLVLQGLTLTPLIRALRLAEDDTLELEEAWAREAAARAALARLEELARDPGMRRQDIERLRALYTQRLQRTSALAVGAGDSVERAAYRRLRHQTLSAERRALIALRDQGVISDEVLHRLEQELNVEAIRMGLGEAPLDD
jgi:monovalent cation/hydrogen antiporter